MSAKTKNILIIDGYGFVFRAYHVQPPLSSPKGEPVGALYGFTSMLLKVLNDFKPEHAVIVFDSGSKNYRHQLYEHYKATRPPVPEDLIPQLDQVRKVAASLNFFITEKAGYEADDIIATLATKATEQKENAIIISSDKDLMQLINGYIKMYDPIKAKYISAEDVKAKFGVEPDKVREAMALIGDSSDNVPGVPSFGPKTAADLINQFGSLNGIYASIEQVKSERQRRLLQENKELAHISWQLVGLEKNVDLGFSFDDLKWSPPETSLLSEFLTEYGFKSLYKRAESLFNLKLSMPDTPNNDHISTDTIAPKEISNIDQLESLLEKANYNGKLAIYLIKHKDQDIGFALSTNGSSGIITFKQTGQIAEDLFSYNSKEPERWYLPALSKALQDQSLNKITYNIKPLLKFFAELTEIKSVDDLQLMDYLLTAGLPKQDMFELANQHIKLEDIIADSINITSNFINSHTKLIKELSESNLLRLYEKIDLKIAYVLDAMEKCGVKLDQTYLKKLSKEFGEKLAKIEEEIFTTSGVQFNIASPKQLGEILFEKMQLPLGKISSKSKSYSTSAEVLEKLSEMGFEIADLLLKWRQLSKLKNTYTDTLPTQINNKTGRVHTTFLQASTTTGRLSSNDPNLQNIPIRSKEGSSIREAFIAEPGNNLISADYSQIELRILADIANVKALKQAFLANEDVHKATACKMFKLAEDEVSADHRRQAKAINFGIIYGQSSFGLAKQIGISNTEAANYIKQYFTEYPEIEEYMNNTKAYAKEHGFVKNLFGRKCNIQYIHDKNFALKQFAERAAINAPIQGANADIIKIAMINLDQEFSKLGLKTKMLLQIHDELLFEAPESEVKTVLPLIKTLMENAAHLSLPLVVEAKAGKNWAEIH